MVHRATMTPTITTMVVVRVAVTPAAPPPGRVVVHVGGAMTPAASNTWGVVVHIAMTRTTSPPNWVAVVPLFAALSLLRLALRLSAFHLQQLHRAIRTFLLQGRIQHVQLAAVRAEGTPQLCEQDRQEDAAHGESKEQRVNPGK